jgi:hypothetical protein
MSYTYSDALKNIPAVPTVPAQPPISTHMQAPTIPQEAVLEEIPLEKVSLVELTAENITFPYYYQINERTVQLQGPVEAVSALIAPLADDGLADVSLWPEASIVIVTGKQLGMNGVLFAGGYAILTNLPIATITPQGLIVEPLSGKLLQVVAANLEEHSVLKSLQDNPGLLENWQAVVQENQIPREQAMKTLLDSLEKMPTLLATSLFEPSGLDWTEFSQSPYRVPYSWPMSDFLAEQGLIDSFRATHFGEETDEGNTWEGLLQGMELAERIDFLYAKDLIPMETKLVEYSDPASTTRQSGVLGYFLIP